MASGPEPAWLAPLDEYTPLLVAIDQQALRREEAGLRAIKAGLEGAHGGSLYFPFAFSDKRPVRTPQGYLVKYPAAAMQIFAELQSVPLAGRPAQPPRMPPRRVSTRGRYQNDPRVRAAVERHAVAHAVEYFVAKGFAVEDVGSFAAYDLHVTRATETRHVEVKGSAGPADSVELTAGEVNNARAHQPTDLYIVSRIEWWREPDGSVTTGGGNDRLLSNWTPQPEDLAPTSYRYTVPT